MTLMPKMTLQARRPRPELEAPHGAGFGWAHPRQAEGEQTGNAAVLANSAARKSVVVGTQTCAPNGDAHDIEW